MSCNQRIISCKSAIPLLWRDHCRNSQFLCPSPYFLIIEEERTCEGMTQLNSGQPNLTKTQFFCSHVIFSLRAPRTFSRKVLMTPRLCLWQCRGRRWWWSCCKSRLILDETFSSFTTPLCTVPALAPLLQEDTSIPPCLGSASKEWAEQCSSPGHISPHMWQEIEAKIIIWKQIHQENLCQPHAFSSNWISINYRELGP